MVEAGWRKLERPTQRATAGRVEASPPAIRRPARLLACLLLFFVAIGSIGCPEAESTPTGAVQPALRLAAIFGNDMVLQRGARVPVWGTARPGANVEVRFAGHH